MMAYASKYYDPVKAHEYYMRTRELKGYENRYGGSRGDGTSAASGGMSTSATSSTGNRRSSSKSHSDVQQHNQAINNSISTLRDSLKKMDPATRAQNRESIMDQIQELREQIKGGSTSGFNQRGQEAAMYIRKQMDDERDAIVKQANKDIDQKMLHNVKKLQADIKAMRASGRGFSKQELKGRIKSLLGEAKRTKAKSKSAVHKSYAQKYKDEIDRLRSDKSMYSYYDRKAESARRRS